MKDPLWFGYISTVATKPISFRLGRFLQLKEDLLLGQNHTSTNDYLCALEAPNDLAGILTMHLEDLQSLKSFSHPFLWRV